MKIDVYQCTSQLNYQFKAVPAGLPVPESWGECQYFKSIDLQPGEHRIGMSVDAETALEALEVDGWTAM